MENEKEEYIDKAYNIFNLLNQFRSNPRKLARHLEKLKIYLDKNTNILNEPNKMSIQMIEGENIFNDAIKYLKSLSPQPPLEWDDTLALSAQQHVNDIGPKGLLTYQSSDGTEPENRITKYGNYMESLGENIDFGPNDEIGVIVSMTLDDGETERPHRNNLFKNEFKKIGIACGPHITEFNVCVMDFAYEFFPKKLKKKIEKDYFQLINNNFDMFPGAKNKSRRRCSAMVIEPYMLQEIKEEKKKRKKKKKKKKNHKINQTEIQKQPIDISEIDQLKKQVKLINLAKKIIKKKVEIMTKVTYRFEDGSTKEVNVIKTHIINT